MPAAIPDRFNLEIRLGRDGDLEEWLATDISLDRPVLVRSLGPETSAERRTQFVKSVGDAAKVAHQHLARVFAVEEVKGGAYSVSEWTGGSTTADRVGADHPIEIPDFVPNASGLAGALAALHESGTVHGAIDLSAISYSTAHAAKLGAFGRVPRTDAGGDVRSLSEALESALTGYPPGGPPPSERIDGLPRAIDRILRAGQTGSLTARELEKAFRAAPTPRAPRPQPRATSRHLIVAALVLVAVAIALVALGGLFTGGGEPIVPAPQTTPPTTSPTSTVLTPSTLPRGAVTTENATSFDPFGEGGENEGRVGNLIDGLLTTSWETERYDTPLQEKKPGVGVTFTLSGTPARMELAGLSEGTRFEVYWSDSFVSVIDRWEKVVGAQAPPGLTVVDLPERTNGFWLVWLTDLPSTSDGAYFSSISEVRFLP